MSKLPCGHPKDCAIPIGNNSSDYYCGWCDDKFRSEFYKRLRSEILNMADPLEIRDSSNENIINTLRKWKRQSDDFDKIKRIIEYKE